MNSSANSPQDSNPVPDDAHNRWNRTVNRFALICLLTITGLALFAGYRVYWRMQFIDRIVENFAEFRTDHSGSQRLRETVGDYWIMGFENFEYVEVYPDMSDADLSFLEREQVPDLKARRKITRKLGQFIGGNPRLVNLELDSEGQVEPGFFDEMSSASSLRTLTLGDFRVNGDDFKPLSKLEMLEEISFQYCDLRTADLEWLSGLPHLKRVTLYWTRLNLEQWRQLAALDQDAVELIVDTPRCTDDEYHELATLIQFDSLVLIVDDARNRGDNTISPRGLIELLKMRGLKSLDLTGKPVGNETLQLLKNVDSLESLSLDFTLVTDDGLPALYDLKNLKLLKLSRTDVTGTGIRELKLHLPGLEIEILPNY